MSCPADPRAPLRQCIGKVRRRDVLGEEHEEAGEERELQAKPENADLRGLQERCRDQDGEVREELREHRHKQHRMRLAPPLCL